MQNFKKKVIVTVLLSSMISGAYAGSKAELNILETTDIHTNIIDYDYYADKPSITFGLARTASLIKKSRKELKNTILVDNGDLIQGNPLADYMARVDKLENGNVHPVYKAMNTLDYDVGNIGNHEFNYGLDFLFKAVKGANFPYVSNTIRADGTYLFKPYLFINKKIVADDEKEYNLKIAVMGFVPPQIMQWDARHLKGKIKPADIVESAKKSIKEIKEKGADVILAVAHSGINTSDAKGFDENTAYYLSKLDGIDALLLGHSHAVFPSKDYAGYKGVDLEKGTINGVPSVMPGFWGSHLGRIKLNLEKQGDKWQVVDGQGSVMSIYERKDGKKVALVEADDSIIKSVKEDHEKTIAYMNKAVGKTTAPIHSFFALAQDDPSVQIVNNAQKEYVEKIIKGTDLDGIPVLSAGAPFKSGGRGGVDYYTNIDKGSLKLKNVSDLYVYPNTLQVVKLTGAQVIEWLEMSAQIFNKIDPKSTKQQELINPAFPSYNFDTIDGINYKIDITKTARYNKKGEKVSDEHRIVDVSFNNKPIDLKQIFLVATNNYRAQGGGHFPDVNNDAVVIEAPDENRNILANYIMDKGEINPSADNNWSFVDNMGSASVVFLTGFDASKYLNNSSKFIKTDKQKDGFMVLKIKEKII